MKVGENLALSILTGNRPHYLRTTVESLVCHALQVLQHAHVVLMVNGPDDRTMAYVEKLDWVDELVVTGRDGVVPIGPATSRLAARCARSGRRFYMHLEDDWRCAGSGWLAKSIQVLTRNKDVGQVRMRHVAERVSRSNMVTHKLIKWQRKDGYRVGNAHYTFNPSLVRAKDIGRVFPCGHENHAMRKFQKTGYRAAQLVPGFFRHIGEASLRAKLGR